MKKKTKKDKELEIFCNKVRLMAGMIALFGMIYFITKGTMSQKRRKK